MTDVLVAYFQEFITVKILKFFEKKKIPNGTSARTGPKPDHLIAEEHHELEQAVKEAALYHLNSVNKKSPPLEGDYRARKKDEKTNKAQTDVSTDKENKLGNRKKKVKNDPFASTTDHLNDISPFQPKNISSQEENEGMNQLEDTTVVAPRKKAEKKKSKAKNERNVDTDGSTSSQLTLRSNAASDFELPVSNLNINIIVVAPQKKAIKKRGKAKNQRKRSTSNSTTPNSNTCAEEVLNGSNMDITSASLPRFNQSPQFDNNSDNHDPNSIPMWFWYLCSLILLSNLNPSNLQIINHITYTDNSRKNWQRVSGKGNSNRNNQKNYINSGTSFKATKATGVDLDLGMR